MAINAVFHCMKDIPSNFNKICAKVFDIMPHAGDVVFSTDSYNPNFITSMERLRRGCGERLIIKGENTKRPVDWKAFLINDTNKQQFIKLLTRLWSQDSYAPKLQGRKVVIINDGSANLLTSHDGVKTVHTDIDEFKSTQEETALFFIVNMDEVEDTGTSGSKVLTPMFSSPFSIMHSKWKTLPSCLIPAQETRS